MKVNVAPEFESIENFAEFLADEDRTEFTAAELMELSAGVRKTSMACRKALESYGFRLATRLIPQSIRGVQSNDNDRWYGKGSSPSHGGSGWEQVNGFAGEKG